MPISTPNRKTELNDAAVYIAGAVNVVIGARMFCGDESEAIREFEFDHGIKFTDGERFQIFQDVQEEWESDYED